MLIHQCYRMVLALMQLKKEIHDLPRNKLPKWSISQILIYKKNLAQCKTLMLRLWKQQNFKMSTKYECDKGSRKNGRNPFATSHDCHFMHISSFTQTLRNRVGTVGMPNTGKNLLISIGGFECLQ